MAYQVIARKWRPQKFSDMVGQDALSRTLRNSIVSDRTAHAYLFVGPRGIGKTTTARIFAKALNCEHPIDGEPCCECESCRAIAEERSVDVIEIDAATHTQVDKARELCEDVLTLPIHSRYKIYIIDEVHMLSTAAWNALLKTIEEPPAHAKFIFATTEVNKVLPTVISRCQRFDLRRIKTNDIAGRLRLICDSEGMKICDGALQIIARAADGGMRDAQSLLDQVISFFGLGTEEEITEAQALSLFGLAASGDMEKLVRALLTNDRSTAIKMIWQFAEAGKNMEVLYGEVIGWLRCVLLCNIVDNPADIIDEGAEKAAIYGNLATLVKFPVIQRLLEQLSINEYSLREALNKQVFMEAIVLKAMRLAHAPQIEDLIARLTQLRNQGELNAVGSVVPLYEMPVGQIIVPAKAGHSDGNTYTSASSATFNELERTQTDLNVHAQRPTPQPVKENAYTNPVAHDTPQPAQAEKAVSRAQFTQAGHSAGNTHTSANSATFNGLERTQTDLNGHAQRSTPQPMAEPQPKAPTPQPMAESQPKSPTPESRPAMPIQETPQVQAAQLTPQVPVATTGDEAAADEADSDDADVMPPEDGEAMPRASVKTPEQVWEALLMDVRDCLKMDYLANAMEDGTPTTINDKDLTVVFDQEYEFVQYSVVEKDTTLLSRRLQEISCGAVQRLNLSLQTGFATPQQKERRISAEALREDMLHNPFLQQAMEKFSGRLTDAFTEEETLSPENLGQKVKRP